MQKNSKISLVVLAAGMGSRYGGLKQLEGLGPNGETILEYSIYDAVQAGFNKVVFIVRDFFLEEFKKKVSYKYESAIEVEFVCQDVNPALPGIDYPWERSKPWGTAQAVLTAQDLIHEPFAVINADDYYGQSSFQTMAAYLRSEVSEEEYSMVGYVLQNTLSDQGYVNRGVCQMDETGYLSDIVEILKIRLVDSKIYFGEGDHVQELDGNRVVSMNFWGFHPNLFKFLKDGFNQFVQKNLNNPKAEYYIPSIIDELIKQGKIRLKVLKSDDLWYGVTYKEDAEQVRKAFLDFALKNIYPRPLWET
jgi:dTDP-glucose pyrophosphorylase